MSVARRLVAGAWLGLLAGCSRGIPAAASDTASAEVTARLERFAGLVEKGVVEVTDGVYAALGYTQSTNCLIVGPDGAIVVDPGHDVEASRAVRAAFERLTDQPVRAIVYTHGHGDHCGGAAAFVDPGAPRDAVQVWSRSNYDDSERGSSAAAGLRGWVRPAFTQGFDLRDDQLFVFSGPVRPESPGQMAGAGKALPPTNTFDGERIALELAGVPLELVAAPGESDDQLYLWLPEQRVLFAGDNVFHSWPNVYSLRASGRDMRAWIASLDKMVAEEPQYLVRGHGVPVLDGALEMLRNQRDAMQWVLERTLEGINQGLTADEVVELVRLPDEYAALDYLADYYGNLEYTVRHLYAETLGWFDGDPLELHRDTPRGQAERLARLVGGERALLPRARASLAAGDALGAAELAQAAVRLAPDDPEPKRLLAQALEKLAETTLSLPARYYTLSYARRLREQAER
jgi:uncharacterized sulfatase